MNYGVKRQEWTSDYLKLYRALFLHLKNMKPIVGMKKDFIVQLNLNLFLL
jgi:hypothetical protein